jgi:hypothetical protein
MKMRGRRACEPVECCGEALIEPIEWRKLLSREGAVAGNWADESSGKGKFHRFDSVAHEVKHDLPDQHMIGQNS